MPDGYKRKRRRDPLRREFYAVWRQIRFAHRMLGLGSSRDERAEALLNRLARSN